MDFVDFFWNSLEFVEFLNENHPPYQQIVSKGINISLQIVNNLGGGFQYFLFSHVLGEMIQFDEHIFQTG